MVFDRVAVDDASVAAKINSNRARKESLAFPRRARKPQRFVSRLAEVPGTRAQDKEFSYGNREFVMAKKAKKRKYSKSASRDVKSELHRYKEGTAKSGRGGKAGKVKSRKQAIAIGLSKARKKGKKVPKKRSGSKR